MRTGVRLTLVCVLGVCAAEGASSDDTAPGLVALVGGEVHTGLGPAMRGATVVLRDGRIESVTEAGAAPPGARVIDVKGAIVTPGLVDADGVLPLPEQERFGPRWGVDLRAADALVRDDPRLATARRQGVTAFLVTADARGNFGGTAALVVNTSPADVLTGDGAFVVTLSTADLSGGVWGAQRLAEVRGTYVDARERRETLARWCRDVQRYEDKRAADAPIAIERLLLPPELLEQMASWTPERRAAWREATLKSAGREKDWTKPKDLAKPPARPGADPNLDLVLTTMSGAAGRRTFLRAQSGAAVAAALDLAREFDLLPTIAGGEGLAEHASELVRRKIPVVISEVADTALRTEGPLAGRGPGLAARLVAAGLRPALGSGGSGGGSRFLRLLAAQEIGAGLDPEDALRAVTAWAAEAAGAADRIGTISAGRRADLVVWDGDPFAAATKPRYVVVGGEITAAEK